MNELSSPYLAALMDGEGSWSMQVLCRYYKGRPNVTFSPKVSISFKFSEKEWLLLKKISTSFGGEVYPKKDFGWAWSIQSHKEVVDFSKTVLPFLNIKNWQCKTFIKRIEGWPSRKGANMKGGARVFSKDQAIDMAIYAYTLNDNNKFKKSLPEIINHIEEAYK